MSMPSAQAHKVVERCPKIVEIFVRTIFGTSSKFAMEDVSLNKLFEICV